MLSGLVSLMSGAFLLFASLPVGTNYKLQSYGMGSGGGANMTSNAYAMEGISGEVSGTKLEGTSYGIGPGFIPTQQANVPAAPTFTNPNNHYNKLHLILDTGNNPSDARFAVAISTDNFTTTQYVQDDRTVGPSLGMEDYQTYAAWGGASGANIIGLKVNTAYKVKVRAMHGKFTESAYSAIASAATVNPALTFDLDVAATDTETSAPYDLAFNDLTPGSVVNSPSRIWVDFDTNGESGGNIYLYSKNGGLRSSAQAYTITALTGDLNASSQGFGAQSASAGQASGGPLVVSSPYDGINDAVGITDLNIRKAYSTTTPITSGRSSLILKAKATQLTPASTDYAEILTVLGAASF